MTRGQKFLGCLFALALLAQTVLGAVIVVAMARGCAQ